MFDMGRAYQGGGILNLKQLKSKGKMVQHPNTGAWQQEYRPNKSMNMRAWDNDLVNQGKSYATYEYFKKIFR